MRIAANVTCVTNPHHPHLAELQSVVVPVLRSVYDVNAARYDELVGDDAVTFGSAIYRNSWFQIEQAFANRDGWTTARPDGSLQITYSKFRFHVYRLGHDETSDPDAYRLDDGPASLTKRSIAQSNTAQLTLALFDEPIAEEDDASPPLSELVIIHAGNPDDGCCGIWVGAPLLLDEAASSPWAWIEPLWLIERSEAMSPGIELIGHVHHDQMQEPDLDIRLANDDDESSADQA